MSSYDSEEMKAFIRRLFEGGYVPPSPIVRQDYTSPMWLKPKKRDLKSALSKKWNPTFYRTIQKEVRRCSTKGLKRVREITKGLTMPAPSSVRIGSGKSMDAAIMFFDLENFTARSARLGNEKTLYALNIIIPQVIKIVKHWDGEIEKSTGDGIMAIFGTETRNNLTMARDPIEVAMGIRYVMENDINATLTNNGIGRFNFKIGIDMGSVLICNIGVVNNSFLTAVGSAANRAYELQELASSNAIFIGENLFTNLDPKVKKFCEEKQDSSWKWHYPANYLGKRMPYRFFDFKANWPEPRTWLRTKF